MRADRKLFPSRGGKAALVMVAALSLGVAVYMSGPSASEIEPPRECGAAAQIVARGRPADAEEWAWKLIRECGASGSAALAHAWRVQHVRKDTMLVSRVYWRIWTHSDSMLFVAAERMALDTTVDERVRFFSLMMLLTQVSPSLHMKYAYLGTATPDGLCHPEPRYGVASTTGIPLAAGSRERVRSVGIRLAGDKAATPIFRSAARCVGYVLHLEDLAAEFRDQLERSSFARLREEFGRMDTLRDVASLVRLDDELRAAVAAHNAGEMPHLATALAGYYGSKLPPWLAPLGVEVALFESESLDYDGRMLRLAHRANPNSPYRNRTLISTLFPTAESRYDGLPVLDSARSYLQEFPNGPHAIGAATHLAWVYDELFEIVRDSLSNRRTYKLDCFSSLLTSAPLPAQRDVARDSAVKYYKLVIALSPDAKGERRRLEGIRRGEESGTSHYCPD